MKAMIYLIGFSIAVALFFWSIRKDRRAKEKLIGDLFVGRDSLKPREFYDLYFADVGVDPDIAIGIRNILEECIEADLSRLSAEDDFSENLSFFWDFDSMANMEIVVEIEKRFCIQISDQEAENTHTIFQLVKLVSKKVKVPFAP